MQIYSNIVMRALSLMRALGREIAKPKGTERRKHLAFFRRFLTTRGRLCRHGRHIELHSPLRETPAGFWAHSSAR